MTASARHVSIFANTGGGRTNAPQVLLLGLFQARLPFLVVDWKRSHRSRLTLPLPEVRNLRFYSVGRKTGSPFNGNPLRPPPGVHPKTWISVVVEALAPSHIFGLGSV